MLIFSCYTLKKVKRTSRGMMLLIKNLGEKNLSTLQLSSTGWNKMLKKPQLAQTERVELQQLQTLLSRYGAKDEADTWLWKTESRKADLLVKQVRSDLEHVEQGQAQQFVFNGLSLSPRRSVVHCLKSDTLQEDDWLGCIWKSSPRQIIIFPCFSLWDLPFARPPPKGVSGVVDQTRGLLDYVEKNRRKAIYTPELRYVCIAGRYIYGSRLFGNSNPATTIPVSVEQTVLDASITSESGTLISTGATFRTRFIGQGYKQVSYPSS
ncbi:hypothetical protein HanHA300_Chr12g0459571 [Helianthus annuus]|nr:hypothetical protein HanHA300_Chr12g0459571 [Helianthus annuus]KAJ0506696.1 hypothetical protein HanHA89_Chr12g0485011 [Helianthus annuus]KAJ0676372.1 hypothetical protein HanLR1_Chr12g0462001 [Helianthus annuus]